VFLSTPTDPADPTAVRPEGAELAGRRQRPVERVTLGGSPAVAYESDRIASPGSDGTLAQAFNIGAVRAGHQYGVSLLAPVAADAAQTRAELRAIAATWRWRR
jgi:hypothetical protein